VQPCVLNQSPTRRARTSNPRSTQGTRDLPRALEPQYGRAQELHRRHRARRAPAHRRHDRSPRRCARSTAIRADQPSRRRSAATIRSSFLQGECQRMVPPFMVPLENRRNVRKSRGTTYGPSAIRWRRRLSIVSAIRSA
jgi:hypothetical protein